MEGDSTISNSGISTYHSRVNCELVVDAYQNGLRSEVNKAIYHN